MDKQHFLDTFKVTVPQMEQLARTALAHGGDWSDLYFENTLYGDLLLKDGQVTSGGLHTDFGVGIRVLSGEKTGYAYSENTSAQDMKAAAQAASLIALGSGNKISSEEAPSEERHFFFGTNSESTQSHGGASRMQGKEGVQWLDAVSSDILYPVSRPWRMAKASELLPFLERLQERISALDSRIVKIIARLSYSHSDIMMFNSYGELACDSRPMGSVTASVIFNDKGRNENKTVSRSFRTGAELLTDSLLQEIAEEVVKGIDDRFAARRPKGGQMPVVMGAGASGILLHEAMGHAFEADFNRKGQSIFSGKIGQQVCGTSINIVDDGTIRANRGACAFDDEGVPGQKTYMVKDGILNSYLHDRISARWYGVSPTGNGRRESFRYNPIPRMRATYMESGPATPSDIISSVKKGIYVDEFSNGQVKIGEGDFTFYVKSGYLIENGRLTAPVKDINIIGNGPQALSDIVCVGNDLKIDNGTWTCGKDQSAPVSCGIPTVLVKSLTVGGE